MKRVASISSALALSMVAGAASADVFVLDFTGVADPSNQTTVGGFYNGGTSGDGNAGTNYGAAFSANAVVDNNDLGEPDAQPGVLAVWGAGNPVVINVAAGFDTGFAVNFITNYSASFQVFDGLDAGGNLLASLTVTDNNCNFCAWAPAGVTFAGVAKSVRLMDGGNGAAFDDLTFGSPRPGTGAVAAVPEPETWALMVGGLGIAGGALRRRRRGAAAQVA